MGKLVTRMDLETAAAVLQFFLMTALSIVGPVFVFYIAAFTRFWYIVIVYLIWIWIFDINTSEKGGRTFNWIRSLKVFVYARKYFPVTLNAVSGFKLDSKRNYMFCCFPHGIMPNGAQIALSSNACGIHNLIPNHSFHALTLHFNFKIPIFRDYLLGLGACSVTPKSVNWLLSYPNGGKIAGIVVGGAAEAMYASPGVYTIVLRNRKGFVRLALQNGSPLVPVFSFGEVDLFRQCICPDGSLWRRFQEWLKKKTGASPLCFMGRGYYQNYVGFVPFRKPINVLIGKPIEVQKNTNPSQEEIDALHQIFMTQLNALFEKYKHKYIENADKTTLTIV